MSSIKVRSVRFPYPLAPSRLWVYTLTAGTGKECFQNLSRDHLPIYFQGNKIKHDSQRVSYSQASHIIGHIILCGIRNPNIILDGNRKIDFSFVLLLIINIVNFWKEKKNQINRIERHRTCRTPIKPIKHLSNPIEHLSNLSNIYRTYIEPIEHISNLSNLSDTYQRIKLHRT